ncbi:MAG: hypothetical protein GKR89_13975 [Candidatus Latescibacteria bacterium]|nr:hypothetical protein [Candidatus Latescibacterota bacterium]
MQRSALISSLLAAFFFSATTAPAVERTSWGGLKTLWEGSSDGPAAKLTVSRSMAGGLRPDMVSNTGATTSITVETGPSPRGTCPEGHATVSLSGSGEHAATGPVEVAWSYCSNPDGIHYGQGNAILTDATGDELQVTFWGAVDGFDPDTGKGTFSGITKATGGTGRYKAASGRWAHFGFFEFRDDGGLNNTTFYDDNALIRLPHTD